MNFLNWLRSLVRRLRPAKPAPLSIPQRIFSVTLEVLVGEELVRVDDFTEHDDPEYWQNQPNVVSVTFGEPFIMEYFPMLSLEGWRTLSDARPYWKTEE